MNAAVVIAVRGRVILMLVLVTVETGASLFFSASIPASLLPVDVPVEVAIAASVPASRLSTPVDVTVFVAVLVPVAVGVPASWSSCRQVPLTHVTSALMHTSPAQHG